MLPNKKVSPAKDHDKNYNVSQKNVNNFNDLYLIVEKSSISK